MTPPIETRLLMELDPNKGHGLLFIADSFNGS